MFSGFILYKYLQNIAVIWHVCCKWLGKRNKNKQLIRAHISNSQKDDPEENGNKKNNQINDKEKGDQEQLLSMIQN